MDYVTISGVCKRTGAEVNELTVFLLKELVDNALDFIELYAPRAAIKRTTNNDNISSKEPKIDVYITYNQNDHYLVIRVKNSNFGIGNAAFTERKIHSIFGDVNVFHSSKRNQFKISRGMQGDALKEVLCIPYVLATKYQSYGGNTAWNEPLIIKNGFGKEFKIRIVVNKVTQHTCADIQTSEIPANNNTGFTEIETHIPYNPKLAHIVSLSELKIVLTNYALLNTHIGFHFIIVDRSSVSISNDKQAPTANTSSTNTIMNLPPTQPLLTNVSSSKKEKTRNKMTSIYYYDLASFDNLMYSIADDTLIVYDVLLSNFREGSNLKKEKDLLISIGQLKQEGDSKIREVFTRLRNAMPPPSCYSKSKQDLVPFNTKHRKKALTARIKQLGYTITNIKYKAQLRYYNSASPFDLVEDDNDFLLLPPPLMTTDDILFPFLVEVAVIHTLDLPYNLFYCEGINASLKYYYSFLQGNELEWTSKSGKTNVAYDAHELMEKYGYSSQKEKSKKNQGAS